MAAYLTFDEFLALSVMPPDWLIELEQNRPGFVGVVLEQLSREIDARLRKRYSVPFPGPAPVMVRGWLAKLATKHCWAARGVVPTDTDFQVVVQEAALAWEEVAEAANAKDGLFDLALPGSASSAAVAPVTLASSDVSPFGWIDDQAEAIRTRGRW